MAAREDEVTHLRELAQIARRDGRRAKSAAAREYLLGLAAHFEEQAADLEKQQPQGQAG